MSCVTKSLFKPLPTANGCLISVPSIFTSKTIYPYLYVPSRHIKHSLSCSYSSSLPSLFSSTKRTRFPCLVSFVSPQKEEDNTVVLEQEELSWGNQETGGTEAPESDWEEETEGEQEEGEEKGFIEAIGDAGESGEEDGFAETEEEGDDYKEPPEEAKLYVGNLAYDIDSEKLAHLFGQAGIVEIAEVIYNRETGQSRGFAFVTMSTVEEAEKAVEIFHRYDANGRLLIVNKAAPRGSKPERPPRVFEPAYRIYVGNLQWDVDNSRLKQVFSEHGKVTNAQVVSDRETGRSRGFGFVMMSCEAEMNDAIANLDGQSLDGRIIKVSVAEERPRRSNF